MKPAALVDEVLGLEREIAEKQKRIAAIKGELLKLNAARYPGAGGGGATVVKPQDSLELTDDARAFARERIETPDFKKLFERKETWSVAEFGQDWARENLKPDQFRNIFQRNVAITPVKSFRDVATAVLHKKIAAALFALMAKPNPPYVKLTQPAPDPE